MAIHVSGIIILSSAIETTPLQQSKFIHKDIDFNLHIQKDEMSGPKDMDLCSATIS